MSQSSPEDASNASQDAYGESLSRFWKGNVKLMLGLLFVWALAGLGCGILFADTLNEHKIGGYPLGFWFAQQGSIIVFVLLILVFCIVMNKRDQAHERENEKFDSKSGGGI
ncbi:MAG: DUF4212 domain-containing protein [Verrucomicrobiota bacterium]